MNPIEFNASIINGKIDVPADLLPQLPGEVHVSIIPQQTDKDPNAPSIMRMIRENYFERGEFVPLTREEAHER